MKILLIRLRLIGDVVFTTPAIATLRRHYPDATITYLVEAPAAPIVRENPHLDEVIVAERPRGLRRLAYDLALGLRLRRARFDLVIDFHGGPRSAWLTRVSGAARRIGYDLPGRFWSYTDRVAWTPALVPPRHSVANQGDLLQPLGIAGLSHGTPPVEMPLSTQAAAAVGARLLAAGAHDEDRIVVVHASASSAYRRWPADRFAALGAELLRRHAQVRVLFTTGPSERELQEQLTAATRTLAGRDGSRVLSCGDFDLAELRALVDRASLYIGGDSGPLHIAATTHTPIVALFGPTTSERSLPWRDPAVPTLTVDAGPLPCRPCDQRRCLPGDFRCLTWVTVEQVVTAASQLLTGQND